MFDKKDIQNKLFEESKIDTKAEIFTCDIPYLHNPSNEKCLEFYQCLADHGNEDLEFYKSVAI